MMATLRKSERKVTYRDYGCAKAHHTVGRTKRPHERFNDPVHLIRQVPEYSVIKLDPAAPLPAVPAHSDFWTIAQTMDELSLVCPTHQAPSVGILEREDHWIAFRVAGTMEFNLTGIVARISQVLADAGIGIFVVSTFDTDYILTAGQTVGQAIDSWQQSGINIIQPIAHTARLDIVPLEYELEDIANNNRDNKLWLDDFPSEGDLRISRLMQLTGPHAIGTTNLFQLRLRSTGEACGGCGFKGEFHDGDFTAIEIGYGLTDSSQGKGLGTELLRGLIAIAQIRGIAILVAEADNAHAASHRILEKNGFELFKSDDEVKWWKLSLRD
jgi:RimJ/RimL family protein N-acetyltransferase